jgi:tripartite-type tricarboxylate transporter receptor subunit TctC
LTPSKCAGTFAATSDAVRKPRSKKTRSIVRKLNAALNTVTAMPDVVAQFRTNGAVAVQSTPEEALRRYQGDIAKFRDIVQRAKIPPVD